MNVPAFDRDELYRYARHIALPDVGLEGQRRLKAGRVLCVGAGGLGSPLALYLAAAGVGTIGLVDDDVVDESNLQRQLLYGTDDVGRSKLDSAVDRLTDVNPHVEIEPHRVRLASSNALSILAGTTSSSMGPIIFQRDTWSMTRASCWVSRMSMARSSDGKGRFPCSRRAAGRAIGACFVNRRRRGSYRTVPKGVFWVHSRASSARCRRWRPSSSCWEPARVSPVA